MNFIHYCHIGLCEVFTDDLSEVVLRLKNVLYPLSCSTCCHIHRNRQNGLKALFRLLDENPLFQLASTRQTSDEFHLPYKSRLTWNPLVYLRTFNGFRIGVQSLEFNDWTLKVWSSNCLDFKLFGAAWPIGDQLEPGWNLMKSSKPNESRPSGRFVASKHSKEAFFCQLQLQKLNSPSTHNRLVLNLKPIKMFELAYTLRPASYACKL